jgi:IS605 OrfB family transposase
MKNFISRSIRIVDENKIFSDTVKIYNEALSFIIDVCATHYSEYCELYAHPQQHYVEKLIHSTSNNTAVYEFDKLFYKLPSCIRRAAIQAAIGAVASYHLALTNWETNGRVGNSPTLTKKRHNTPALYRGNGYRNLDFSNYSCEIKVYHRNDWIWHKVRLRKSDVDSVKRNCIGTGMTMMSPSLVKRYKRYELCFAFMKITTLAENVKIITAVDLGVNNAATMIAMQPDGTILGREIFKLPREQDHLRRATDKLKSAQKQQANAPKKHHHMPKLHNIVNGICEDIAAKTAKEIMRFAVAYHSDTIVFEHLDMQGKRGSLKLAKWKYGKVQRIVTTRAHLAGMHISHINAQNTSKLAFDGSGKVVRGGNGKVNCSICKFTTGKQYHADLNAAYNIGARYWIRERFNALSDQTQRAAEAKVPALAHRTSCTLSDLIRLNAEIAAFAA